MSDPVEVVGPAQVSSAGRSADRPGSRSDCPGPPVGSAGQVNGQGHVIIYC